MILKIETQISKYKIQKLSTDNTDSFLNCSTIRHWLFSFFFDLSGNHLLLKSKIPAWPDGQG